MATKYPYYPMYVDDFDEDPKVRAMTLEEVGLFQLCLNSSWRFNGLPVDVESVALDIRRKLADIEKAWPAVRQMYKQVDGRLLNSKQEAIRAEILEKSVKAKKSADKRWGGKDANAMPTHMPTHSERNADGCADVAYANEMPRAYDSGSVSKELRETTLRTKAFQVDVERFQREYPKEVNQVAQQLFVSVINSEADERLLFQNLGLYRKTDQWKRGIIPAAKTWLSEGSWKVAPKDPVAQLEVKTKMWDPMEGLRD